MLIVSGRLNSPTGAIYGQILEVTPDGSRVFELNAGDLNAEPAAALEHFSYRAQRIGDIRE